MPANTSSAKITTTNGHFEQQQAKITRDVEHQLKCLLNTAQLRVLGRLTVDRQDVFS